MSRRAAEYVRRMLFSHFSAGKSNLTIWGISEVNLNGHNLALLASLSIMLDERNITRAAAKLNISQPALSAQLARLRELFDDPLLIPAVSGKGMVMTPRGAHLREPLRLALLALEDVVNQTPLFEPAVAARTFTIGANDNAAAIIGPRLVQLTREACIDGIRFAFRGFDLQRLPDLLESGEIDLALTSRDAVPGASQTVLLEEAFMMAQRKGHPRGTREPSLDDYIALEHVIVSGQGGGFRGFVDDLLAEQGLQRRVGVSVQFYSLVPLILQSSDMVCTLPARFLDRYRDSLLSLPLPFQVRQFSLYAAWHTRFDNDAAHIWLRERLHACVALD
ncbi:LysR family transcriptional regulator [Burkholderia vietnamiensis]|uniref:LysR family transcriptional regulator n=1 Tax=Burkholderia vietnamiensis TaxID=60552 RepID=UPI002011B4E5|nr:LysR family transcriptional regulator [Burkholderia vietnamiensis]